jgi:hypothetical protein
METEKYGIILFYVLPASLTCILLLSMGAHKSSSLVITLQLAVLVTILPFPNHSDCRVVARLGAPTDTTPLVAAPLEDAHRRQRNRDG